MPAKSGISTSAVQLTATSTPVLYGTLIVAAAANAGKVHIGLANTVTANAADATDGIELSAGGSLFVPRSLASDVNQIWVIGSAATQKAFYQIDCWPYTK
jgi:hypothetical protein